MKPVAFVMLIMSVVLQIDPQTATATQEPGRWPPPDVAEWQGPWVRHGFVLTVDPDGYGLATWRTYQWCSDPGVRPPCDLQVDRYVEHGGAATLHFIWVQGNEAVGYVVATNDNESMALGPLSLTLLRYGMASLRTTRPGGDGFFSTELCGPRFVELAPAEFVETLPCGV